MIHEHARQVVAYGPVHEHRRRRRVHPTRETTYSLRASDLLPYLLDRIRDYVDRRPVGGAAAGLKEEVLEDLHPVLGVPDLRVELYPEEASLRLLEGDDRDGRRLGGDLEALRDREDGVAVTRPRPLLFGSPGEEQPVLLYQQVRAAVLPDLDGPDLTAHLQGHELHPITDSQSRRAELEEPLVHPRR